MAKQRNQETQPVFEAAAEFQERLARGAQVLAGIEDVQVGGTPREIVYSEDKMVLYRYLPEGGGGNGKAAGKSTRRSGANAKAAVPVLICYALVNRPYILDLQPDRSLIRGLLRRGVDVYLMDWGTPDSADRGLRLEDFIERYIHHSVDKVCAISGHEAIDLLGVCQGGTLSLCYTALHPERIRKLITMVTPVDFQTADNLLTKWAREVNVDALVKSFGNVPGDLLNVGFMSLMPFRLTSQKYVHLFDAAGSSAPPSQVELENFLRMEKWIADSPDQPGEMFRQFVQYFYKENRLMRGGLRIGGKAVELAQIKMPVLNIYAGKDHLVPPSAARPLESLVGTRDYRSLEFPTGHIGIYVSRRAQEEIPEAIVGWLNEKVDGKTKADRAIKPGGATKAKEPKAKR